MKTNIFEFWIISKNRNVVFLLSSPTLRDGIVVMQDRTDSNHLLSAISVCWPRPDTFLYRVRVRYINSILSTFTFSWEYWETCRYLTYIYIFSLATDQLYLLNCNVSDEMMLSDCPVSGQSWPRIDHSIYLQTYIYLVSCSLCWFLNHSFKGRLLK